jgi:hypothetical protein
VLDDLAARSESTCAVFDSANAYVQVMDRKRCPTVYVETVDPGYQGDEPLSADQQERLARLGWTDPKEVPMPYESANYANEWSGGNFAREWPRDADPGELAAALVETLEVYGLDPEEPLGVTIFPSVGED